jgi:hypothetical protein
LLNSDEIRLLETQNKNEDYTCKLCIEIIDTSQSKSRTIQKVAEASEIASFTPNLFLGTFKLC